MGNTFAESNIFERKLMGSPDEEVFSYSANRVNRKQLLCWGTIIFSPSNKWNNFRWNLHSLSCCSCLSNRLIHHANKGTSNRQPQFCEKAGCSFQKAPFSLFPGKSVILETKTPPWQHNSLSQPTPLFPLTQIPSREPGERCIHLQLWLITS